MRLYLVPVMGICFGVDALLLMGTNRVAGFPYALQRTALSAGLGALYAGACMLPALRLLRNGVWRLVVLVVMGTVAYGMDRSALRRTALFALLNMATGGLVLALGGDMRRGILPAAVVVCVLCLLALRGRPGAGQCVPVILEYKGRRERILALRDTGNMLKDPVTGESVLVVGAEVAQRLMGLSRDMLSRPLETIGQIPGLRLIPYRTIGKSGGLLLAIRMNKVQIGQRLCSALVAFAPEGLDGRESYQALTGGVA